MVVTIIRETLNNTLDPNTLVTQVTQVVNDIDKCIKECNSTSGLQDLYTAAEDEFFKYENVTDATKCRADMDKAFPEAMAVLDDLKNKKVFKLAGAIAALASTVTSIETDCKPV